MPMSLYIFDNMVASEMYSISLSVDGTIKLTHSLQRIDTTHTFHEAIEEFLAQNHIVFLFEIDPQHMKVYVCLSSRRTSPIE